MPRPKPWLKQWISWVDEPKYLRMTMAEQTAYWRLYALAHRCNAGGLLVTDSGSPLSVEEIANTLHIISPQDLLSLHSMLEKMDKEHEIIVKEGALFITSYEESQALRSSDTKEAMAERQRLWREEKRRKEEGAMSQENRDKESSKETPPPPIDKDKEGEGEGEGKFVTLRTGVGENPAISREKRDKNVTLAEVRTGVGENPAMSREKRDKNVTLAEVSRLYEEYIGLLTPPAADQLREFVENYKGEVEWLHKAFEAAGDKRRWPYVAAILERYQDEGGPNGNAAGRLKRRTGGEPEQRPGADQPDPLEVTKRRGWKVKRSGPGD